MENWREPLILLNVKRINNAIEYNWGYGGHSSSCYGSFKSWGEKFGVLNVASPGKTHFSEEELVLLNRLPSKLVRL